MNTEHIVCHDGGCNAATMAALMNNKSSDPAVWASLMNNGGNNWMNNPWIYFVFLAMFGGNGIFGNRNGEMENANSRAIASLSNQISDNHNNDLALQAINGNRAALGQLAQTFNCDINQLQTAVCGVKSAIEQVGGAVGYSAESVKNAIALGNNSIIQQMCNCCCTQKELIQRMGYEAQLQNCQNQGQTMARIDQLANGVQQGFSSIGYQSEKNTSSILQGQSAQTQTILAALNNHWTQDLRDKLFDMSQQAQTASIVSQLKTT